MQAPSPMQSQNSTIGKTIVIKGEITASEPLYIYGHVDGSIRAPEQRVTIGREGKVNADISAHEVVIMGDVCGNLDSSHRVEIHRDGSLTGDLSTDCICIEEGAVLQGAIDIRKPNEKDKAETSPALEPEQVESTPESDYDRETWANLAVSEPA
jgi:cytoskeletal protein CcmA (bactofilin family)